jgi:adenylosuccinate synthase
MISLTEITVQDNECLAYEVCDNNDATIGFTYNKEDAYRLQNAWEMESVLKKFKEWMTSTDDITTLNEIHKEANEVLKKVNFKEIA